MTQSPPDFGLVVPEIRVDPAPAHCELTGCPWHEVKEKFLRQVAVHASKTYFDTNNSRTITFSSKTKTISWTSP